MRLVLSIFPGLDMLGRAFEEEGFCVVRGPDPLWGGDIRRFHPPPGAFWGVIGGDPCQAHSPLAAINRRRGLAPRYPDLTDEFARVVTEAQPEWFLRENVPQAPDIDVRGYHVQTFLLNNRWLGEVQNRLRRFWFGSRSETSSLLAAVEFAALESPEYEPAIISTTGCVYANGRRRKSEAAIERIRRARRLSIAQRCQLQGLPADFLDEAPFTTAAKRRLLANGVPLPMGRALARAIELKFPPLD